jgi:NAD(P)-dependent dehydrogenase (short-subunit alcohol dehydrogenase family)
VGRLDELVDLPHNRPTSTDRGAAMDFKDQTAVITGAAGNLGRAVAQAFADRGARLVLIGRTAEGLARAFGSDTATQWLAATDLLDQTEVDATLRKAVERYGRVDVLCNIAGGFRMGDPVHGTADDTWDLMFDLNVRTLVRMSRAVVPLMLNTRGGRIVNVGAFAAQRGSANMGAYIASKSAVIRLTESMAAELREQGINVNCVLPTILDTPENRAAMPSADPRRWVALDDLANVILFLASPAARAIHGAAVPVSGLS